MHRPDIKVADWNNTQDLAALRNIRLRVFVEEQHVPLELEWDEFDEISTHFLASIHQTQVATARLKADGQLGRMAVLAEFRKQGVGSQLLKYVFDWSRAQSMQELYCHAQISALEFYQDHGFIAYGEEFEDAGIAHRAMRIRLDAQQRRS